MLRFFSYLEAHSIIRSITGYGEGNGPYISIHDGFVGLSSWADFLPQSDRIALDTHPYFAFSGSSATAPIDTGTGPNAGGTWPAAACQNWASGMNARYSPLQHFAVIM
jgi:glucan 1,3-beta-glucosidase